jgi:hypothetical protein
MTTLLDGGLIGGRAGTARLTTNVSSLPGGRGTHGGRRAHILPEPIRPVRASGQVALTRPQASQRNSGRPK